MDTIVTVTIGINVGEVDTYGEAVKSAQDQIRSMDIEELIRLMDWKVTVV